MSTRHGSPEPLGTGENRGPLSLGTSTPQRNYTYIFWGWRGKKRSCHWLLQNFGRTLVLPHSGTLTNPVGGFWDTRYLSTNFNGKEAMWGGMNILNGKLDIYTDQIKIQGTK